MAIQDVSKEQWIAVLAECRTSVLKTAQQQGIKMDTASIVAAIYDLALTIARFEYEPQPEEMQQQQSMVGQIANMPMQKKTCATCGAEIFVQLALEMAGCTYVCPACGFTEFVNS